MSESIGFVGLVAYPVCKFLARVHGLVYHQR